MIAGTTILASAFIFSICSFFHFRKRFHNKLKIQQERQAEAEALPREVLGYALDILNDLMETAAQSGDNPQLLMSKLKRFIFTGDESRQGIIRYMQPIANFQCHGIVDLLREVNPRLTEEDLTFCSLLCLGFAPNSIQMLYGQSNPASFYNRRSRIRKKLGIADNDRSLESVLTEMVSRLEARNTISNKR